MRIVPFRRKGFHPGEHKICFGEFVRETGLLKLEWIKIYGSEDGLNSSSFEGSVGRLSQGQIAEIFKVQLSPIPQWWWRQSYRSKELVLHSHEAV